MDKILIYRTLMMLIRLVLRVTLNDKRICEGHFDEYVSELIEIDSELAESLKEER